MKIFLIKKAQGNYKSCYPVIEDNSPWCNESLYANEYENIHELPIHYVVENKHKPDDFLVSTNNLVSENFMHIAKKLNKNIYFFDSQMYFNNEKIWEIYYTLILPHYNIMNKKKSIYIERKSSITGRIYVSKIQKLVFDVEKIEKIQDDNFFTMVEMPTSCYCTEKGKNAIEVAGLKGIAFEEIPVE